MSEKWKAWWKAAGMRAIKTLAQTAVGCIGAAVALGDVNWPMVASAAVLAAVVSLLTSVAGLPEVEKETANKNERQRRRIRMANRFYANRMAIKAISEKEGVDVDIASRMYAQQQGWTGWEKEMDEWNDIQRSYMKSKTKTLADLFR